MTDRKQDIVERIRARIAYDHRHYPPADPLLREAAAEIERLRAIVASQDKWVPKPYCETSRTSYVRGDGKAMDTTVRSYSMPISAPPCPSVPGSVE